MKGLWTIIKKEFARFFGDKKLVASMILPGVLIFVLYSVMGSLMTNLIDRAEPERTTPYQVAVLNDAEAPKSYVARYFQMMGTSVEYQTAGSLENGKTLVSNGTADILVVYSADFDEIVADYVPGNTTAPQVEVYFDSNSSYSTTCYDYFTKGLNGYEESMANKFDVNAQQQQYDLTTVTVDDVMRQTLSGLLPFLVVLLVFTGAVSITPESIAGEKERGTIATMLVTPVKRSTIAVGKILSLSCFSSICALSTFLGIIFSLPKLMVGISFEFSFGVGQYVMLFFLIITLVPLLVGLVAAISANAKSVKEAASLTGAMMIVVMMIGLSSMFGFGFEWWMCLIPIFNVVAAMGAVLSGTMTIPLFLLAVGMNLVYNVLIVVLIGKMFNSERIMNI